MLLLKMVDSILLLKMVYTMLLLKMTAIAMCVCVCVCYPIHGNIHSYRRDSNKIGRSYWYFFFSVRHLILPDRRWWQSQTNESHDKSKTSSVWSCHLLRLVSSTGIFWTELSWWHKSYTNKATLLLCWSHRSSIKTHYGHRHQLPMDFPFYVDFLPPITDTTFTEIDYKQHGRCPIRNNNHLNFAIALVQPWFFAGFCVAHLSLIFLCCVLCFVCLHFEYCAQCCLYLWIVHSWLPPRFSL
jgi:hypothetical protein